MIKRTDLFHCFGLHFIFLTVLRLCHDFYLRCFLPFISSAFNISSESFNVVVVVVVIIALYIL